MVEVADEFLRTLFFQTFFRTDNVMQTNKKLRRSYRRRRENTIVAKLLTSRCLITIGAGPPVVLLEFIAETVLRTVYLECF